MNVINKNVIRELTVNQELTMILVQLNVLKIVIAHNPGKFVMEITNVNVILLHVV